MSQYKVDPNDSKKMIPANKPSYIYPHAIAVNAVTCSQRPTYVQVSQQLVGNLYFTFDTTGSVGDPVHGTLKANGYGGSGDCTWIDFTSATGSGGRIDISPTAWSSSRVETADQGTVVFVYNDGRNHG